MKNKKSDFQSVLLFEQVIENLTNAVDEKNIKNIALVGVDSHCGTDEISHALAETLAISYEKILFITVYNDGTQSSSNKDVNTFKSTLESVKERSGPDITRADFCAEDISCSVHSQDNELALLIENLEDHYDVILWSVPPTDQSTSSRMIAKYTQGVVLIVDSGRTRWQAARYSMEHFKYSGAHMLGVILNRKKNYIPNWLYRLLFRGA